MNGDLDKSTISFVDDVEWLSEWERAMGRLAHSTLLLLRDGGSRTKFELGRFASEHSAGKESAAGLDLSLLTTKLANVALGHLVKAGFAAESQKKYNITGSGLDALGRYPDVFSPLFVQRELVFHLPLLEPNHPLIPGRSDSSDAQNSK